MRSYSFFQSSCSLRGPCQVLWLTITILTTIEQGASECDNCPINTIWTSPDTCSPCPPNTFALPGDSQCRASIACQESDYYQVFTPCVNGSRDSYWLPNQPKLCHGNVALSYVFSSSVVFLHIFIDNIFLYSNKTGIECAPCPQGFVRVGSQCKTCNAGHYFDEQSKTCVPALSGMIPFLFLSTF